MAKEKVFIVLFHKHSLTKGSRTQWETAETVEFVNQLRRRHYDTSSVIADYLDEKMITGSRFGFDEYSKFDQYIRKKYEKQMKELDALYKPQPEINENTTPVIVDDFGNVRAKTVFDII